MQILAKIYIEAAALCFYLFILAINKTLRVEIVGAEHYYKLKEQGRRIIFIFWHQASFVPIYLYRNRQACILTIGHLKGEILARTAERLGYQVTRLEKESDRQGTLRFYKRIESGFDANLAVDGPEGPPYKMKPGAVFLAAKLKYPILPVAVAASPKITLSWRWDKYFIPLPFAKVVIVLGKPVEVGGREIAEGQMECEKRLNALTAQASGKI
ncbi:MAG: DUF374 domain-containing protein [Candidatus Margulisbacteria bacterium]|nr:DUF374 domain-containing protein [Candidatus Margulisiibacteriota bacterium]